MPNKSWLPYILAFLLFTAAVILCVKYTVKNEMTVKEAVSADSGIENTTEEPFTKEAASSYVPKIKVYITGAVVCPDVYEIPEDYRVIDAVNAAGGFCEGADKSKINLAAFLSDGDMINIPFKQEEHSDAALTPSASYESKTVTIYTQPQNAKVNINTADISELTRLNGIGEAKAAAIAEYRKVYVFESIEDIKKVSGISESIYQKIKDDITV